MKKFFLMIGGVVVMALLAYGLYLCVTFGLVWYIVQHGKAQAEAYQKTLAASQTPEAQQKTIELMEAQKPLPVDPEGYQTEDNWLATTISREIAEMTQVALYPEQSLPQMVIKATVDPAAHSVDVQARGIGNVSDVLFQAHLTPDFAWDPAGYAPLSRQLLGNTSGTPPQPVTDETDILSHLLTLTGTEMALEDMRLSEDLRQNPKSWQVHGSAALLLTALALRENAGPYSDIRDLLCRATAHLALAKALRQDQPPTWPEQVADAAVRTLSGREVDAVGRIDKLTAEADCPASAKTWLTSLRMIATGDWRGVQVTSQSPLLLKIAWFQVLSSDLPGIVATYHLDEIVPEPAFDPLANPNQQPPRNPEDRLPDWGRAVLTCPFGLSVENGHRFTEDNMEREFDELGDILKIESSESVDKQKLAAVFATEAPQTVSLDASGKTTVQVIGASAFKAAARHHLFNIIGPTYRWYKEGLGMSSQAELYLSQMDIVFRDVPFYELLKSDSGPPYQINPSHAVTGPRKTWPVWEIPAFFHGSVGGKLIENFYAQAVPFGTAFEPEQRIHLIDQIGRAKFPPPDAEAFKKLMALPDNQRTAAVMAFNQKYNSDLAAFEAVQPKDPTPFVQQLQKLAPHQYALAIDHAPPEKFIATVMPFLDYNIRPTQEMYRMNLSKADQEVLFLKEAAFEPETYFALGQMAREQGKDDEAASYDRKGYENAYDQVWMSDCVLPLVDYDLNHGLQDEAVKIAEQASDTGSDLGMGTYCYVLEKLGQLTEEEALAKDIQERYNQDSWLNALHIRHPDRYPDEYAAAKKKAFPNGMVKAEFSSFKDNPKTGCVISSYSWATRSAHLLQGDVIVALDGTKVDSEAEYLFLRSLSIDPHMDFIVWRNDRYLELKAYLPDRRFFANLSDYISN